MLETYRHEAEKREALGIPSLPLDPEQTRQVTTLLQEEGAHTDVLVGLLADRVEPGVGKSAKIKAV